MDARGRISCCTDTLNDQSDGRLPQPLATPGSKVAPTNWFEPNSGLLIAPQKSMPSPTPPGAVCVPCAAGIVSSQSGTKSPSSSCHVRVTDGLANPAPAPPGI